MISLADIEVLSHQSKIDALHRIEKSVGVDNILKILCAAHQYNKHGKKAQDILEKMETFYSLDHPRCKNLNIKYGEYVNKCVDADNMFHDVCMNLYNKG